MPKPDRRRLLAGWTALLGLGAAAAKAGARPATLAPKDLKKETDIAVLYHCDFGDPQRFAQLLGNINCAGIKFFLKDLEGTPWAKETLDPDLAKRIAAVAELQSKGFAYLKVG